MGLFLYFHDHLPGISPTFRLPSCSVAPLAKSVIAARRKEPLEQVQKEIQSYGGKCDVVHPLNIREAEQCYAAVKTVLERHGRLDGLGTDLVDLRFFGTWHKS